jgi:ABC-type iron transport system FetAB permease component
MYRRTYILIVHLLNSRTVKVFASCRTVVQRLVIFTLTLVQKLEISNLKLSLINSVSFIQHITYTKWLHKKKIWNVKEYC